MRTLKNLFCIFLLTLCANAQAKVLLWDLGGVLFQPDKLGVAKEIGLSYFATYMLSDWRNPNIQAVLFDVLEQMERPERGVREKAGTGEGVPLPTIMCHWQAGTTSGPEIIRRSDNHLKRLRQIDYFESDHEYRLIKKTIHAMFNPKILARNIQPVPAGFDVVRLCGEACNKDGSKKNRNFVFSNWDDLSFDIFYKNNRAYFKPFEKIVISGHIKLIKPRAEAYKYLLETYKLDPKDCILIDDQEVNVIGARKCGIKCVLIKNGSYEQVKRDLKQLGAL